MSSVRTGHIGNIGPVRKILIGIQCLKCLNGIRDDQAVLRHRKKLS
jgi:hypothetical protein